METYSALLAICAGNSLVPGEFPAQRPVTRSFDVFFDLHPNKRLSKQWWGCWFDTPSRPLLRHSNVVEYLSIFYCGPFWHICMEWYICTLMYGLEWRIVDALTRVISVRWFTFSTFGDDGTIDSTVDCGIRQLWLNRVKNDIHLLTYRFCLRRYSRLIVLKSRSFKRLYSSPLRKYDHQRSMVFSKVFAWTQCEAFIVEFPYMYVNPLLTVVCLWSSFIGDMTLDYPRYQLNKPSQISLLQQKLVLLKRKCNFDDIFIIGCMGFPVQPVMKISSKLHFRFSTDA